MNVNWILIVWPMIASACLTIAGLHLLVWFKNRTAWTSLLFSMTALAAAAMAFCELWMMRAATPAEFGTALRWIHVPAWVGVMSLLGFVLLHLRAGRPLLAWMIGALRTFTLVINFTVGENLNYLEITRLYQIQFFGESVSVAGGITNPWMLIGQLSLSLFVVFVADATITVWRRGDRRLALITGGSMVFFMLIGAAQAVLVFWEHVQLPITVSFFFMFVILAMSYEMSRDVLRAAQLAMQLKASQISLRLSERRLDQAAEAASIGTWEWNFASDEIWMTDRARALFGVAPSAQMNYRQFLNALHPDDRVTANEAIERSRKIGGNFEREYRILLPDGSERWISSRGRVEAGADGTPVIMRGIASGITKRKQADERFARVVESAPIGIIVVRSDGVIELVNARAEADFGYSHDELVGQSVETLIPERVRARHVGDSSDFFSSNSARPMVGREVSGRHKDGSEVPLELGIVPIHWQVGPAVLVTIVNISERKRNEDILWRERAFLRKVIDIAPNLIFAKDRQGRFTLVNQAVADLYRASPSALIGKTDADFNQNAEEVENFRRVDLEIMNTRQEQFISEEKITDAAGKVHWLQTVKRPILDDDGAANQVLGSSTDITARKETELELGRRRNELAHLSRVTMLSELSGSLAHELNQPLAAILSNAQAAARFLAEEKPNLDEVREILQDIVSDDKRAGEVIQGLRLLLKKGERRQEQFDVNDLVRDVLRLVNSDILNAGVNLTTRFAANLPLLIGDRVQLQQVMLNLVMNGCDAMLDNAAVNRNILVTTESADKCVLICVADQGHGIQANDLERIFEPFYTTKVHGLGLGLAVCRQIFAAHSGHLSATNNEGSGATFCLMLPVHAKGAA